MNSTNASAPVGPVTESTRAVIRLPSNTTVSSIAPECRHAWTVFVSQSEEWGKAEQILWSAGFYEPIRRYTAASTAAEVLQDLAKVNHRLVQRMIRTARFKAIDVLTAFAFPRARLAFGVRMRSERAVTPCVDYLGNTGYLPTPLTGVLADRVLSLIAADLLNRPGDFEGETLCSSCGGVVVAHEPCCAKYEGRDTGVPSRRFATVAVPDRKAG